MKKIMCLMLTLIFFLNAFCMENKQNLIEIYNDNNALSSARINAAIKLAEISSNESDIVKWHIKALDIKPVNKDAKLLRAQVIGLIVQRVKVMLGYGYRDLRNFDTLEKLLQALKKADVDIRELEVLFIESAKKQYENEIQESAPSKRRIAAIALVSFFYEREKWIETVEWYTKYLAIPFSYEVKPQSLLAKWQERVDEEKSKAAKVLIQVAKKLIDNGEIEKAKELLQKLVNAQVGTAMLILQKLEEEKSTKEIPLKSEETWIKLLQMPEDIQENKKAADWRIIYDELDKHYWFELKDSAKDPYTLDEVKELIEAEDEKDLPCLIVLTKSGDQAYQFYDGINFASIILGFKDDPSAGIIETVNKQPITQILLFVKEKGEKNFSFLKQIKSPLQKNSQNKDVAPVKPYYVFFESFFGPFKKEWATPGEAQFEVAKIFEQEAKLSSGRQEEEDNLKLAYTWYEYAYNLLTDQKFKQEVLQKMNGISELIKISALKPKKPKEPIIIFEKPKEQSQDNELQKNLINLTEKLKNVCVKL